MNRSPSFPLRAGLAMLGLCLVLRTPAVAEVQLIDRKAVAHDAEVVWPHDLMEAWEQEWIVGLIKRFPDFLGSRMCWMSIQFSPVSGLAPRLQPTLLGGPEVWEPCCYFISQDYGMQMLRKWTGDDALPPQNFWHLRSGGIYLSTGMHASYISFYEVDISGGLYCFNTDYDRLLRLIRLNYAVWQQYYSDRLARSGSKLDGLELYDYTRQRVGRTGL